MKKPASARFNCWAHNPVATLALCLVSQVVIFGEGFFEGHFPRECETLQGLVDKADSRHTTSPPTSCPNSRTSTSRWDFLWASINSFFGRVRRLGKYSRLPKGAEVVCTRARRRKESPKKVVQIAFCFGAKSGTGN
ncbi:hypothetical protein M885DRAFT_529615 [Pelagophyceae sp. CCMP2097]|nr:hypothetical protein M885DRAFT_529615 [Pelagophyceae sp. CCMP2097]